MKASGEHRRRVEPADLQKDSSETASLFRVSSRRTRTRDARTGGGHSLRSNWVPDRWMDWIHTVYRPAVLDRRASVSAALGPVDLLASNALTFNHPLFHISRDSSGVSPVAPHLVLADHCSRGWGHWGNLRMDFSRQTHEASWHQEALKGDAFKARRKEK